jgi:SAM-dependent methyltransferase
VARFVASRQRALEGLLAAGTGTETLIDVGCGSGEVLAALRPRVGRAIGIDLSRPLLELARAECPQAPLAEADAHHLPFPDGAGHIILAVGLLDYVERPRRVLAELARATAPGGRVLLTYPQRPSPFWWLRRGWGARLRWWLFRLPPIQNAVTWGELQQALSAAGLVVRSHRSLWGASWLVEAERPA